MDFSAEEDRLVSVVIPVFNAAAFLRATLDSVRAQSHREFEILAVVDPASTDASASILNEIASEEARLRVFCANGFGASAARNLGLDRARGRYVSFLDADDLWLPGKLERQLAWMRERQLNFSATGFRRIDEGGERLGRLLSPPRAITHRRLLKQNSLCCSSVMIDRKRVGRVRFESVGCEDFALWLKLTREGFDGFGIPEDLVRYRVVRGSRGSSKLKTAGESWVLLRRSKSFVPALFGFGEFLARGAVKHARF